MKKITNKLFLSKVLFFIILINPTISKSNDVPQMSFEDFIFAYTDYKGSNVIVKGAAFNMWTSPSDKRAAMCESALCKEGVYVKFDKMETTEYKKLFLSCKENGVKSQDQNSLSTYYCGIGDALLRVRSISGSTKAWVLKIKITER
tara:strand:- start:58 stop:495 length:438 start_codon:yes stop_codon:yes gene_type:complete